MGPQNAGVRQIRESRNGGENERCELEPGAESPPRFARREARQGQVGPRCDLITIERRRRCHSFRDFDFSAFVTRQGPEVEIISASRIRDQRWGRSSMEEVTRQMKGVGRGCMAEGISLVYCVAPRR